MNRALSIGLFCSLALVFNRPVAALITSTPHQSRQSIARHHPSQLRQQQHEDNGATHKFICVDCAIVGGGPAGLAAAIGVTKANAASTSPSIAVFERDDFSPKGASIQISRSGWGSIENLDETLVDKLEGTGVPVTAVEVKSWKKDNDDKEGQPKRKITEVMKNYASKIASKIVGSRIFSPILARVAMQRVHLWHDVRVVLRNHANHLYATSTIDDDDTDENPLIYSNCNLIDIQSLPPQTDELTGDDVPWEKGTDSQEPYLFELTFEDTASATAVDHENPAPTMKVRSKFLLACDGTNSRVRSLLPNEPSSVLLQENKSVWRGMAPNVRSRGKATFFRGKADSQTDGRSALLFPGGKNAGSSWTVISDVEDGRASTQEECRCRVLKVVETMKQKETNDDDSVTTKNNKQYEMWKRVIDDSSIIIENKLQVRDFTQQWESNYDGLAYFGDAAHPVRPTGQGIALAFEDAFVLREVIEKNIVGHRAVLSVETLREYERERYEPVKFISEKIRANANSFYKKEEAKVSR